MASSVDDIGRTDDRLQELDGQDPSGQGSPKGKARRILGSPPVVTAMLLMLVMGIAALAWKASSWKRNVAVSKVVVTGVKLLSRRQIESSLAPFTGRKLAEVHEEEILRVLNSQPYIREAKIARELNGIIRVIITERQPLAMTMFQGRPMIVDNEGMLLPDNAVSGRFHRLPQISGITGAVPSKAGTWRMAEGDVRMLDSMIAAFAQSDYAGLMLRDLHLAPGNQSWFFVSGSSIRFILGNDGNFKEKLKKFEIFWQKVIAKKGLDCYESVDLRFRERVFAKEPEVAGPSPAPSVTSPAPASQAPLPAVQPLPR
jgi:cell division protein FtsQ